MKPFLLPASTSIALIAGALATIVVWAAKQWGHIDVPEEIKSAFIVIVTAAGSHFTTDSPSGAVAREAVADAAVVAEASTANDKMIRQEAQ